MSSEKSRKVAGDPKTEPYCTMCSSKEIDIYHQHLSTFDERLTAICESDDNEVFCKTCETIEKALQAESMSKRILLVDSSLHGFLDQKRNQDIKDHFEVECVIKGKLRHLNRALKSNFLYLASRLEIIVVGGLVNVGKGEEASRIINEMEQLKEMVLRHSLIHRHTPPSYVSFCTLPMPPMYCSLYLPENADDLEAWRPGPGFINRLETIETINTAIKKMNEEDGLKWVNLNWHGIKLLKSGKKQHKFDDRPGATKIWDEVEVFKKLHFNMDLKLKIIKFIIKCFKDNGQWSGHISG